MPPRGIGRAARPPMGGDAQAPPPAGSASVAPPTAAPASEAGVDDGEPNVSPEEQAQYDEFVENGLRIIYAEGQEAEVSPPLLAQLRGEFGEEVTAMFQGAEPPLGSAPHDALSVTGAMIVLILDASADQAGAPVDDDVVMHAGVALLEELGEVSEAAGIADYSEQDLENAFYRAADLYRLVSPRMDQAALQSQFEQIVAADKAGELGALLPGIEGRMGAATQGAA